MAMTTCPECGNSISNKAKSCVHCGISFLKNCPQCGRVFVENASVCPECGVKLNDQNAGVEADAVKSADAQPEKQTPVELHLTAYHQRVILQEIKKEPEAKKLATKRCVYSFLGYGFLGLFVLEMFVCMSSLSQFNQFEKYFDSFSPTVPEIVLGVFLLFNIYLFPVIFSSVMLKRAENNTRVLNKCIFDSYQAKIEQLKKELAETGAQPTVKKLSEGEYKTAVNKVGIVHLLTGFRLFMTLLSILCLLLMGGRLLVGRSLGFISGFIGMMEGKPDSDGVMMGGFASIFAVIMPFVMHIVVTVQLIQNAVVGGRAKKMINKREAKLLSVSENLLDAKLLNSFKYDQSFVLYETRESISRKVCGGMELILGVSGIATYICCIGFFGEVNPVAVAFFITCWVACCALGIVKEILLGNEHVQCYVSPYLATDEAFLKAV